MTRSRTIDLLTIDEARNMVGTAAVALADVLARRPDRLGPLLTGTGTLRGLSLEARTAARNWRQAVAHVNAVGLAWVVADETEGALSYANIEPESVAERAA